MAGTWQEALMLLHERGWPGELVDEACEALIESCLEGKFQGRLIRELTLHEVRRILGQQLSSEESRALCGVAEVRDRSGDVREALRDLDTFADSLGGQ